MVFISPPHSPVNGSLNKEFAVSQETPLSEIPLKSQMLASTKASDLAEFLVDPKSYKPSEDISTEKISPLKNSPVESKFSKVRKLYIGCHNQKFWLIMNFTFFARWSRQTVEQLQILIGLSLGEITCHFSQWRTSIRL